MRQFACAVCAHIYDEAIGDPESGIPAGTVWEDVPDDWVCPECGVDKSDFEMIEPG
ncbi:MAG: rubredoxin [Nitrosomonadaceae bacterium]|jgi:rubredoxin|nr:rubredoxin [Nitrosospira sp.]MDW7565034.1 rubredoxin [Nitrosomonadaceae bacterium]MBI0409129.1 rubredoxin [Nitrosospira sp.]MBI0409978.1 rubredoxin [Nitrosospira sp.]MBI0412456.1 rubredoxin [Nitrosospira sp.]